MNAWIHHFVLVSLVLGMASCSFGRKKTWTYEPSKDGKTAIIGTRAQTIGLEDGDASRARAYWGGGTLRFHATSRWQVFLSYDFGVASTTWSGSSNRLPGVTSASRVDTTQLVQLGIGFAR